MTILRNLRTTASAATLLATGLSAMILAVPAQAQFQQEIGNDMRRCSGAGPAVRISLSGVKASKGTMRVQLYRGIASDWLEKGRWIHRIEAPARQGVMTFCMPVPQAGTYAIAIRHDLNGNGGTDIFADGGGMSNNPSINVFNLGKPSYRKTAFPVGNEVKPIAIQMRYM